MDDDFITGKIGAVFIDGKPVDDLAGAVISNGCTMALSGLLPGLAGASLRCGGALSGQRSAITYQRREGRVTQEEGIFTVKLFNTVVEALGPLFLRRGIVLSSAQAEGICSRLSSGGDREGFSLALAGHEVKCTGGCVDRLIRKGGPFFLTVEVY